MNTNNKLFTWVYLAFSLILFSCGSDSDFDDNAGVASSESISILKVSAEGTSSFVVENICRVLDTTSPLTADEIEFLYALREDEKMGHDLNVVFSILYPTALSFTNISRAEATHIATIEKIFDYYEIEYPALSPAGLFTDEDRQSRYDELLAGGNTLVGAYKVIASLEEENIVAYNHVLENIPNPNIKIIVSNLLRSSRNHLRSIVRQMNASGEVYTPVLLDDATYQEIISSKPEQGNKYQQKGSQGQNTNSRKGNHQQGRKGSVNKTGVCTGCINGNSSGNNSNKGNAGKGYRGGQGSAGKS
ncbi:DUF2202 domain-containing protein [Parabacteroides sp. OttesenSCG-928-G06]|nr:DUF2202 domain-containing protein [Parabacteroides sp. OttesenSCG-928-G06]